MLPDPIHPLIVHFPVVLAILVPLAALWALVAARRAPSSRRAWLAVVALAAVLVGSTWLAVETGENEEERVEEVLASEAPLSRHEERADQFLAVAVVALALALAGLAPGRVGGIGRAAATVAALVLIPAGIRVGHSGGELVYVHGAAQAYTTGSPTTPRAVASESREGSGSTEDRH